MAFSRRGLEFRPRSLFLISTAWCATQPGCIPMISRRCFWIPTKKERIGTASKHFWGNLMELIFATNNRNKVEEIQAVIGEKFRLRTLEGIGCYDDIPETGETFEENAGQKSLYLHERYGLDCFADDSGLEVAALGGKPGVHSARYSGSRDMEQNMDLLLRELGDNPDRRARFRTVISLRIRNKEYLFEGSVPGRIIYERTGSKGFGY